jgi:CRP-like cAMP-binding protein
MKEKGQFSALLQSSGLFTGIEAASLESMLACLGAKTQRFKKGQFALCAGDRPEFAGIVLSGQFHIVREDYAGNRSLVTAILPGGIFAEALCCADISESPIAALAAEDSLIMKLNFERVLDICPHSCPFHKNLIRNMLHLIARKNIALQGRMEILEQKSVRGKVMRYLESFLNSETRNITIPFNREEMADFLGVERSALSHELAKMKKDGLLEYRKNHFLLKLE